MSPNVAAPASPTDGIVQMELSLERDGSATFEAQWILEALRMGVAAWAAAPAHNAVDAATRYRRIDCVTEWIGELENEIELTKQRRDAAHKAAAKGAGKRGG